MAEALDPDTLALAHEVFELTRQGAAAELGQLLEAGLPPDLTDDKGDTLLILAAYHDHPDAVRLLLDHGADHARLNDRGQTALGAAVFRRSLPSVRALLAAGADPALGSPSAVEVARLFDLADMAALLRGDASMAEAMQLLDGAEVVLVVDWPSRDVPDTLAQAGFTVVVQGGPSPDRVSIYEVIAGEVAIRRLARPADRADLLYCHRPVDELPGLVERAADLGAAAVWLQSGLGPDGAKDPTGCWMPADDLRRARRIVEAAGLTFLAEPYIADVARAVGPRVS